MVWAMGSMSAAHIYRMATDFGGWHLDFTGPLMVMVQKITLLAYALHDGKARKDSDLKDDQRKQKIDTCPSLLEYFTYMFNFHSILAGPSCTIKEFLTFMDGSNLTSPENPNQYAKVSGNDIMAHYNSIIFVQAKEHVNEPSAAVSSPTTTITMSYTVFFLPLVSYCEQAHSSSLINGDPRVLITALQ